MALTSPDYSVLSDGASDHDGLVTGIIRNAGMGRRDTNLPCLWFDLYVSEDSAALVTLDWGAAHDIVGRFYDFRELNGRPAWADVSTPGVIRFVRLWAPLPGK